MLKGHHYLAIATVAFLAALAGVGVGRMFMPPPKPLESDLHRLLHDDLDLNATQEKRIHELEQHYDQRRQALENEMRQDNTLLAAAIRAEHGYGPQVSAAIDRSHRAMGELQKATLQHVFAMRNELRPDQAKRFEEAVASALTTGQ